MTCIVGLVDGGQVYLGGDAACAYGMEVTSMRFSKVFVFGPGEIYLAGYTTSFRMGQILQYHVNVPGNLLLDPLEHVVVNFVPTLRQALREHGYSTVDKNHEETGEILMTYRGRLFLIGSEFQVLEPADGMAAIGSGREYALGALVALRDLPAEMRVYRALETSAYWSAGVRGPFSVICQSAPQAVVQREAGVDVQAFLRP